MSLLLLPLNARYCLSISLASCFTACNRNLFLFSLAEFFLVFCALGCVSVTPGVTAVGRRTAETQVAILAPECAGAQSLHTSQLAPPCPLPSQYPPPPYTAPDGAEPLGKRPPTSRQNPFAASIIFLVQMSAAHGKRDLIALIDLSPQSSWT